MIRALVTGGAGFIGSHLVELLLKEGQEVYVLDNLLTGSLNNLKAVQDHPLLHVTVGSASDRALLKTLIPRVDYVYHLAASVGVKHIMDHLISSIQNNIDSTVAVLEVASQCNKKVLLTSSSEVYGKSNEEPSRETDSLRMGETVNTRWSYACSKALDEYLAFAYLYERGLPVTIARLFNTVGDRQSAAYGMVLPTFIHQALLGEPLTIHGDGTQSRCFIYVKDVVSALHALMQNDKANGQVFNIGGTELVTVSQIADRIIALTGTKSEKQYIPYAEAYKKGFEDTFRRQPNIEKIKNLIDFEPRYTLNDILGTIIDSVKEATPSRQMHKDVVYSNI